VENVFNYTISQIRTKRCNQYKVFFIFSKRNHKTIQKRAPRYTLQVLACQRTNPGDNCGLSVSIGANLQASVVSKNFPNIKLPFK